MVTITVAYLVFAFSNPDYQIAKYDLAHGEADVYEYESVTEYITGSLSPDAAPALKGNKKLMKDGDGVMTALLRANGIEIYDETYIDEFIAAAEAAKAKK